MVYEVTARVDDALAYDYERYMIETHMPDVVRTGCFLHARLDQGGEGQYRAAYLAALREHMTARFPTGVTLSRRVWTERTQWP